MRAMSAILYPIAETADQALHTPLAFAARAREAMQAAGGAVEFVSEAVGPAFVSEAAAEDAYRDSGFTPGEWRMLRPVTEGRPAPAVKPANKDGRRWPEPTPPKAQTLWRLSVSYWRVARDGGNPVPSEAARRLRRDPEAQGLDTRALQALAGQPLRATEPQRPLDIGLFEVRLPEAPDRIVPDE
jgi:hypothetical protein